MHWGIMSKAEKVTTYSVLRDGKMKTEEDKLIESALWSAMFITASPHEWKWSQKEQEDMARGVLLLYKKNCKNNEDIDKLSERMEAFSAQYRVDNLVARVNRLEGLHE